MMVGFFLGRLTLGHSFVPFLSFGPNQNQWARSAIDSVALVYKYSVIHACISPPFVILLDPLLATLSH